MTPSSSSHLVYQRQHKNLQQNHQNLQQNHQNQLQNHQTQQSVSQNQSNPVEQQLNPVANQPQHRSSGSSGASGPEATKKRRLRHKEELQASLAEVRALLARIASIEARHARAGSGDQQDGANNNNPWGLCSVPDEGSGDGAEDSGRHSSSGHGAGESQKAKRHDVFTKERRPLGPRMTVASGGSDGRAGHGQKREAEVSGQGFGANKKSKIEDNGAPTRNGDGRGSFLEGTGEGVEHKEGDLGDDGYGRMDMYDEMGEGSVKEENSARRSGEEAISRRQEARAEARVSVGEDIWRQCSHMLKEIMDAKDAWAFNQPVNVLWPDLKGYDVVVKKPMDLGRVKKFLDSRSYEDPRDFAADVRLTFSNALLYNAKHSKYHTIAKNLKTKFDTRFRSVEKRIAGSHVGLVETKPFQAAPLAAKMGQPKSTSSMRSTHVDDGMHYGGEHVSRDLSVQNRREIFQQRETAVVREAAVQRDSMVQRDNTPKVENSAQMEVLAQKETAISREIVPRETVKELVISPKENAPRESVSKETVSRESLQKEIVPKENGIHRENGVSSMPRENGFKKENGALHRENGTHHKDHGRQEKSLHGADGLRKSSKSKNKNKSGVNPRLGRLMSRSAYGGVRPLTNKEKEKLSDLIVTLPPDRMRRVVEILKTMNPDILKDSNDADVEVELDLENLDMETQFELYRLTMNWQKSKKKVSRRSELPRIFGDHDEVEIEQKRETAVASRPLGSSAARDEEEIDIMGGSPVRPKDEISQKASAKDDSSSDSGSSSDSSSGSSSSSSGSGSSSDSESEADAESDKG